MIKFGNTLLRHGLFLGPMAGYSDYAMRMICREWGAEYLVTEMVSAKAICYGDKKTFPLAVVTPGELPCAVQIFGSDPEIMARAAQILLERAEAGLSALPTAIDLNMGCPMPKIVNNGEGAALMKDPANIERIVRAVSKAVPLPVTVKLRAGFDDAHKNAPEAARAAEAGGAALICVHGRTKTQLYAGDADWTIIRKVKEVVSVPVVANGDITSAARAKRVLDETGVDGIMVARGAIGNPFIFQEIGALLTGSAYIPPTVVQRTETALRQLRMAVNERGEHAAVQEARKQLALYIKGTRGAANVRARINNASTYEEVSEILAAFLSDCSE